MRIILILLFYFFLNASLVHAQSLDVLTEWMQGSFSSEAQSQSESGFFHVHLEMSPIWIHQDETWLYVEQAMATRLQAPYRQRVYRVYQEGDVFVSAVYELQQPDIFRNAYNTPEIFEKLDHDNLIKRAGCSVYLHWNPEGFFEGGTRDQECASTLQGASYATSEVQIHAHKLLSWDRGFDAEGRLVWGSRSGAYRFMKIP